MNKFEWKATESAPKNFAMKIVNGDFVFPDGNSLYIPNGKRINKGWGTNVSSHIVGDTLKPLPNRLEITFFSYIENEFYQGSFDLPYEKILSEFQNGHYSPKRKSEGNYTRIMAGVAPGGVVAVWLYGPDKITEVFYGNAEKADIPWTRINDNPEVIRDDYVRRGVEATTTPEILKAIERDGVPLGLWDSYRVRYNWQPAITAARPPKMINELVSYNGEKDYLVYPLSESEQNLTRPVPKEITIIWKDPNGKPLLIEFFFDETEVFKAFKQLAPQEGSDSNRPLELDINLLELDAGKPISVWLRNKDESVQLVKTRIDTYKASLSDDEIENL